MSSVPFSSHKYVCIGCAYCTERKSQYDRHVLTAKHKRLVNPTNNTNKKVPHDNTGYNCICGKQYKHITSLYAHKRKCIEINNKIIVQPHTVDVTEPILTIENTLKDFMMEIFRSNTELRNVLLEKTIEPTVINNITNVTNVTNNTQQNTQNNNFNLQLFLNETCKDAITANQFANNIEVSMSDLHNVGIKGYVEGLSQIIINELRKMDITKRPFHCTDLKREVIYIKDADAWNKDNDDKSKLKLLIGKVARKNLNKLCQWQAEHQDLLTLDSDDYFMNHKLLFSSHGGDTELTILKDKVIKLIAKEIHLDRSHNNS